MSNETLNTARFATLISRSPEFRAALPRASAEALSPEELTESRKRAFIKGAAAAAFRLEQERGAYDLDTNLTNMIAHLDMFYTAQRSISFYRARYAHGPRADIPEDALEQFHDDKRKVTEFNHILREVINASTGKFDFNELLTFMTNQHTVMGGKASQEEFYGMARNTLVGMRNEIAVEQVLITSGVEYELGTEEQDAHGGDFIIDGVGIDVKASEKTAEHAKYNARLHGYNDALIVWSHINFEDYQGSLVLPQELNERVASDLLRDINAAVTSEKYRRADSA